MTEVISCKEFVNNGEKYFEKALNEQVFVQNGDNVFVVTVANDPKRKYRKPDNNLLRSISMEEFRVRVKKDLKDIFENVKR
jgi:hypothetical protein